MYVIRKQAFVGMNETLQTVRQMQKKYPDQEQRVTLLTFDSGHTTWHYDNAPASRTKNLDWKAYNPGGGTPLYDAIGKGIAKVNAQVEDGDHVLVTIITDGERSRTGPSRSLVPTTSMLKPWHTLSPSRNTWSSSRTRKAPRRCLPANAAAANVTTAASPKLHQCPKASSSTKINPY